MYSTKESLRLKNRVKTLTTPNNCDHQSVQSHWFQSRVESATNKNRVSRLQSIVPRQKRNSKIYSSFKMTSWFKKQVTVVKHQPFDLKPLTYFMVGKCNNEQLISKILKERDRWAKHQSKPMSDINLIWGYPSGILMSRLKDTTVLSRIPGSNQMTDKGNLYEKVSSYCQKQGLNLNFLPITFFLDREGPQHLLKSNVKEFVYFFNHIKQHTNLSNTWIMKPTNMNQGRDISLFDSLTMLTTIMNQNKAQTLQKREKYFKKPPQSVEQIIEAYVTGSRSLVLQKYIQNPLLINGHKFDIRMWILVDHLQNFYIFEQGYLRFSSQPYLLNKASITDNFMHLTNHSLQRYSPTYSQNQCLQPISVLKNELQQKGKGKYFEVILAKMKEIVQITVKACLSDLKSCKYRCFELYGFDFLIDRELNVRLIEANCNPAITLDNDLLAELIPKMINDAFKLTIDKIYGTKSSRLYHVPRLNSENGWVRLGNLQKS